VTGRAWWGTPVAAVLAGLLSALAFPPVEWVVLLPLAPVIWMAALFREESRWRALVSGALFGLAYWCAAIPWIAYVVMHYGGQSGPMGVVCLVLLAAILAQWPAIVAWGAVACAPPGSAARLAAFPVLWMATEHARCHAYRGFPWNLTAHALYRHPVWLQPAAIGGAYVVGFFVFAVAALLTAAVVRRRWLPLGAAAALALAVGGWGAARMVRRPSEGTALTVVLLQPNQTEETRATPAGAARAYAEVLEQARDAADAMPDLIVVPESALPVYWDRSYELRQELATIARAGRDILFNDVVEEPDGRYYNAARLLTPKGLSGPAYRKVHLVPFGEYVPLPRVFFFVRQISTEIGAFSPAPEPTVLRADPLAIGVGICYEILYPSLARAEVASGANLLATISNDSWYGRAGAQQQHFAGAVIRAVENERYLVRAAITGISGIVDARGRILAESPADVKTTVTGRVRLHGERTAWTRWGFWLPRIADILACGVLILGFARLRRGPRGTTLARRSLGAPGIP
jgi:apolipoprotein N-acyltransferase